MPESSRDASSRSEASRATTFRRTFLYILLAVMICAIVYDYVIARPAVRLAYQQIETESRVVNAAGGTEFLSNKDVHELLDKQPSDTFMDGDDYVEVFTWTGGLIGKPHKLWAVYKPNADEKLFYRHAMFVYEGSAEVAVISRPTVGDYTDEQMQQFAAEAESSMESNDGERNSPQEMFSGWDTNADGKLTGDEIPGRMSENLTAIDTNEDGSVSLEELNQRIQSRRNAFAAGAASRERGGRRRGERLNRASMFQQLDANGDGKLSSEEIPDGMRASVSDYDADGDGELTLEEVQAQPQSTDNDEGSGSPKNRRPEMESDE